MSAEKDTRPGGIRKGAHEAWCGRCGDWVSTARYTKRRALKVVLREGWKKDADVGLLCPACAQEKANPGVEQ